MRWWRISKKRTMVFRKISQSSQSVQFRRPNEKYRRRTYCRTDVDKPGIRSTSFVRQLSSDHSTSYTVVRRRCRSSRGECLVLLLQQWESETAHHKKRTCVSPFASIHRRTGREEGPQDISPPGRHRVIRNKKDVSQNGCQSDTARLLLASVVGRSLSIDRKFRYVSFFEYRSPDHQRARRV